MTASPTALVESIPPVETVRAQLSESIRETELLRRMLRLAEQREKYARVNHPSPGQLVSGSPPKGWPGA